MIEPVRTVFMGSPEFAVPALTALLARPDLVRITGVVTQPDKPAGRGQRLTAPPVKLAASAWGVPILQPTKMKTPETLAALVALAPEVIVVAAYGRILPPPMLELPRFGCVNVHASLLPRHRGASPVAHAILAEDAQTGISIMRMDEGLDTGPVYAARAVAIAADDTTLTLGNKLAALGAELLVELLPAIFMDARATAQPTAGVTYAPLLVKNDGWLNLASAAHGLAVRVRAMVPWPLAFLVCGSQRVQVLAAHAEEGQGKPGRVLATGTQGVVVGCGSGVLVLDAVKPAGKSAMSGGAWAAGRGIAVGDVFDLGAPLVPNRSMFA